MSALPLPSVRKGRAEGALPGSLTGVLAMVIYLLTLAPDVSWSHFGGDGGELITASTTLGIPHPPGYPTYVLVGKLVSYLPTGSVAYRYNLLSAASMAVAASFLASIVHRQLAADGRGHSRGAFVCSVAVGLAFAYSPLVWSQATITEVYGLNLAFLAAFLWSTLGQRPAWQSGLLLGLAVTSHLTSLLMLPAALLLVPMSKWPKLVLGMMLGLSPFLALPILARSGSPVVWGEPTSAAGWWWTVSGRLYRGNAFAFSTIDWVTRFVVWARTLLAQYTLAGPFLIAYGFFRSNGGERRQAAALLLAAVLYNAYSFAYDSQDWIVYMLPGLLLLALLLTPGMRQIGRFSLLLPVALLLLNFAENDLSDDSSLRASSQHLLDAVPQGAVLLTPGDATIFALWYYHHVEQQRQDIVLVDRNLFAFDWYRQRLQQRYPGLKALVEDDLEAFRMANLEQRPHCRVAIIPGDGQWRASRRCDGGSAGA